MIYYTGDIHGDPYEVIQFCDSKKLTEQDTLSAWRCRSELLPKPARHRDEESSCRRKADDALHPRQP